MAELKLSKDLRNLAQCALLDAFPKPDRWKELVLDAFGKPIEYFSNMNKDLPAIVFDVLEEALASDKYSALISAARKKNPDNRLLMKLEGEREFVQEADEAIVRHGIPPFGEPTAWRAAMKQREQTVCRVENPEGKPWGTGFLVSPDLVLTCMHVWQAAVGIGTEVDSVVARFDFRRLLGGDEFMGTTFPVHTSPVVAQSPRADLDFVLLRLEQSTGLMPVEEYKEAPERGWVQVQNAAPSVGQSVYILQHPAGASLKLAEGQMRSLDSVSLRYDANTLRGSSGSPVFRHDNWTLVGMHQQGENATENGGIRTDAILSAVSGAIRSELDVVPPAPSNDEGMPVEKSAGGTCEGSRDAGAIDDDSDAGIAEKSLNEIASFFQDVASQENIRRALKSRGTWICAFPSVSPNAPQHNGKRLCHIGHYYFAELFNRIAHLHTNMALLLCPSERYYRRANVDFKQRLLGVGCSWMHCFSYRPQLHSIYQVIETTVPDGRCGELLTWLETKRATLREFNDNDKRQLQDWRDGKRTTDSQNLEDRIISDLRYKGCTPSVDQAMSLAYACSEDPRWFDTAWLVKAAKGFASESESIQKRFLGTDNIVIMEAYKNRTTWEPMAFCAEAFGLGAFPPRAYFRNVPAATGRQPMRSRDREGVVFVNASVDELIDRVPAESLLRVGEMFRKGLTQDELRTCFSDLLCEAAQKLGPCCPLKM